MVNKSRGDIAYNIIDVEGKIDLAIDKNIANISGIVNARKL